MYSMACIFNTVLLDLAAGIADSFEGGGAYSTGAYWRFYGTCIGKLRTTLSHSNCDLRYGLVWIISP